MIYLPELSNLILGTTLALIGFLIAVWAIKGILILLVWQLAPQTIPHEIKLDSFSHKSIAKNLEAEKRKSFRELFAKFLWAIKSRMN